MLVQGRDHDHGTGRNHFSNKPISALHKHADITQAGNIISIELKDDRSTRISLWAVLTLQTLFAYPLVVYYTIF